MLRPLKMRTAGFGRSWQIISGSDGSSSPLATRGSYSRLHTSSRTSTRYAPSAGARDHVKAQPSQNPDVLEEVNLLCAPRRLNILPIPVRGRGRGDDKGDQQ